MYNSKLFKAYVVFDEVIVTGDRNAPTKNFWGCLPFDFDGFRYNPQYSRRTNELIYYSTNINGLMMKQFEQKVRVENSLSRFFYGNNANDITLLQAQAVINQIEEKIGMGSNELDLRKIAIGFTIKTSVAPMDIIETYRYHRGKEAEPMKKSGATYGVRFEHQDYAIKIYSKTLEQQLHYGRKFNENLLRIEIVMKRKFIPPEIKTIYHLTLKKNWKVLYKLFISKFDEIVKEPYINDDAIEIQELAQIILCQSLRYMKALKKHNYNTYKTTRRRFMAKMKKHDNSLHNEIRVRLHLHFNELIRNTFEPILPTCNIPVKRVQSRIHKQQLN